MSDAEGAESALLAFLRSNEEISNSEAFAQDLGVQHELLAGTIKSLHGFGFIVAKDIRRESWELTEEGISYSRHGSPEVQVFDAIPEGGISREDLQRKLEGSVFSKAVSNKWLEAKPLVTRRVAEVHDVVKRRLLAIKDGKTLSPVDIDALKKRKLVSLKVWRAYSITKGENYAPTRAKAATDLTREMMAKETWAQLKYKTYNFQARGQPTEGGYLHPLAKVRSVFRQAFLKLGGEEMPTNSYVESFWNFEALFQPQQHPARDAHDTFFLKSPCKSNTFPEDYLQRVKMMHERGGYGSIGYMYDWNREEAEKNVLRTHTTAVSSRMLYKLAQDGFAPKRYFSIDRVFRNESVDRTHLAEFHQIEGLICDKNLTLGDLIGVLYDFFSRLGMKKLRFKPAYNPYTEPSMEIFSYHEQLKKWVEIGNSGMFRPEMLRPMGLPEDVSVIAWGLSLERPTMILYGIDNIRDLFGHKVDLKLIRSNPICRLGLQHKQEEHHNKISEICTR